MAILIKAGETTAANKRVYFQCVDATDGMAPETGEAGGQPQISTNGAAFTDTGIGVLVALGNGRYYGELTDGAVDTAGRVIECRYKSANTAEAIGTTVQVVAFDPHAVAGLGLTNLDAAVTSREASGAALGVVGAAGANLTALGDTRLANLDGTVTSREAAGAALAVVGAAGANLTALGDTRLVELAAANIPADVDTLKSRLTSLRSGYMDSIPTIAVDVAGLNGDAMRGTDGAELTGAAAAAVAGLNDFDPDTDTVARVTLVDTTTTNTDMVTTANIATAVWAAGTRTLTSFGTLVTSIWAHASAVAIKAATDALAAIMPGGVFTAGSLINAPSGSGLSAQQTRDAMKLAPSAGAPAAGSVDDHLDDMPVDVDTRLTAQHGAGSWQSAAGGGGANTVTVTVTDGTNPVAGIRVTCWNSAGTVLQAGPLETDTNGECEFNLDAETYLFIPRSTLTLTGGSTSAVVSGATAVTCAMTYAAATGDGMTYGELQSLVQGAMAPWMQAAVGRNQVTKEHVALWVQQAVYRLDADIGWTQERDTITTVADQRRYSLDEDILRVQFVTYTDTAGTVTELTPLTYIEEIAKAAGTEGSGTPRYWSWYGEELALYPTPDTTSETIGLWTVRRPAGMSSDADIPTLPAHLHGIIVLYALHLAYTNVGQVEQAQAALGLYQQQALEAGSSPFVLRGVLGLRRDKNI